MVLTGGYFMMTLIIALIGLYFLAVFFTVIIELIVPIVLILGILYLTIVFVPTIAAVIPFILPIIVISWIVGWYHTPAKTKE